MAEDLRLVYGGRDREREVPGHPESPTWVFGRAYDEVRAVIDTSLAAYQGFCEFRGLPHSYLLGLDILISGTLTSDGAVSDIGPVLIEGPCTNSNPACPYIDAYRLFRRSQVEGIDPDAVGHPTHPTEIQSTLISVFRSLWQSRGGNAEPVVAILTRSHAESEEETAHELMLEACKTAGIRAYRVTPCAAVAVEKGKLVVDGVAIDVCYRRIERRHMPVFYGEELANKIITGTPETVYLNPFEVDVLRSKAVEELCFRHHEVLGGQPVRRPYTLIGDEASAEELSEMMERGGYALKAAQSMGGRNVELHFNKDLARRAFDKLYGRYDGARMHPHSINDRGSFLAPLADPEQDTVVQQLRVIDSRSSHSGLQLAYDLRVNVLFDPELDRWRILSGISRCVPMGWDSSGNSLVTNVNAGAHIAPLFMGPLEKKEEPMTLGPLLAALNRGETDWPA